MSRFEEDVLFDCLLEAMSWRDLHDMNVGGRMNAEQLLELAKSAGLSEEVAQKLATQRAEQRMKMDLPI